MAHDERREIFVAERYKKKETDEEDASAGSIT